MAKYSVHTEYAKFLKLVKLDESRMGPDQKRQLKRAFVAGAGQFMMLLRDEVSALPEDEACKELDGLLNEVANFWLGETKQQN